MPPQKILVTGSGGCIGAWVVKLLLEAGKTPIAFDLSSDRRRAELLLGKETATSLIWETGDIASQKDVFAVVEKHNPQAIIHLAALQVPFCKADPSLGAQVNVVGSINIFEAAAQHEITRVAYAGSVAVRGMLDEGPWLKTLYGAYKVCNEQTAKVYFIDRGVPSIGIRPSVVYGLARDQGMSALPTLAILAACLKRPFQIPFCGEVGFVYAEEVASAFIQAISVEQTNAEVFDLNGICCRVEDFVSLIHELTPRAHIEVTGKPLPFPAHMKNTALIERIGSFRQPSIREGIEKTMQLFRPLISQGYFSDKDLQ